MARTALLFPLLLATLTASIAHAATRHVWSRAFPGATNERVVAMAADADGTLFIATLVDSVIDFGGGPLRGEGFALACFDATGAHAWSHWYSHSLLHTPNLSLVASGDGGVVVAGSFRETLDFGGTPLVALDRDIFLVKLDRGGRHVWSRRIGDPPGGDHAQSVFDVDIDAQGNIAVTGLLQGAADFGGGELRGRGTGDCVLAMFRADGSHLWSRTIGSGVSHEIGRLIAVGRDGIAVAGTFTGTTNLGGASLVGTGSVDLFVTMRGPTGDHVWSWKFGNYTGEDVSGLGFDTFGNLLVCGFYWKAVTVDDYVWTGSDNRSTFVFSFSPAGALRWGHTIVDPAGSRMTDLDTDASGTCYVVGRHNGAVTVAGIDLRADDSMLVQYDVHGSILHVGQGADRIMLDSAGDILLAGTARRFDLGGGTTYATHGADVYIGRVVPRRPPRITVADVAARVHDGAVEVQWTIESEDALGTFSLRRRIAHAPEMHILALGEASEGEHAFVDDAAVPGQVHTYELVVTNDIGEEFAAPAVSVMVPAATTRLLQNAPNPFNPTTTIRYSLAERSRVSLSVYDAVGAIIVRLDQGERGAGWHEVVWDGRDEYRRPVASGIYFYRLDGVTGASPRKMVLLK